MTSGQFSVFLFVSIMGSIFAVIALTAIMFSENRTMALQHQMRLKTLESENRAAHIRALQAQIDPHFMHNTLSTIVALVKLRRTSAALECMQALSGTLRYKYRAANFVPLSEELEHVQNYLTIQAFRYGDRFEVDWNVDWSTISTLIPALTVQPLVENAVEHAWNGSGTVLISISIQVNETYLCIDVSDDGIGIDESALSELGEQIDSNLHRWTEEHIGLLNVHRRIQISYGQSYGLDVRRLEEGGTRARLTLPLQGG